MTDLADMLTVEDVARIVGLSPYTVRAAIRDGDLRASKMRGRYRVHPDAVAAWVDDSAVRPGGRFDDRADRPTVRPRTPLQSGSVRARLRAARKNAA